VRFPWLTVVVFAPLAGAVILAFVPRTLRRAMPWTALAVTLVTFGLSLAMLGQFHASDAGYQLVERATWVAPLHFEYVMGVDGISLFLVLLTAFLFPIAILASWRVDRSVKAYLIAFLVLETACLGSFLALDLLLFFVFFEALLFPMYLIIGGWGSGHRAYAAVKFFLYTMAGSAFLLFAILFLYFKAGSAFGQPTFDITKLAGLPLSASTSRWLFLAFFVAFAVKVPLVPIHTWQPDAYTSAPPAGTLILAAVLAKVGAYGLIRFNLSLFPSASVYFRTFVEVLAVVAILYGAVVAIVQTDAKRLIAYSSLSHMGFIVLGTFALTLQGVSGSVLYMVNHGLSTGALFLLVGMLAERTRTRDLNRMGGLGARIPIFAGVFLFVALASIGLPGLNNFVSEFLVLLGTFVSGKGFAVAAVIALVLSAIYMLWAYQRMMHGVIAGGAGDGGMPNGSSASEGSGGGKLRDLVGREYLILVPLIAAILFLGLYPRPLLSRINPAAGRVVACVTRRVPPGISRFPGYLPASLQVATLCDGQGLLATYVGREGG
jgi:NADH-quinone oxidoreductase subunit M